MLSDSGGCDPSVGLFGVSSAAPCGLHTETSLGHSGQEVAANSLRSAPESSVGSSDPPGSWGAVWHPQPLGERG